MGILSHYISAYPQSKYLFCQKEFKPIQNSLDIILFFNIHCVTVHKASARKEQNSTNLSKTTCQKLANEKPSLNSLNYYNSNIFNNSHCVSAYLRTHFDIHIRRHIKFIVFLFVVHKANEVYRKAHNRDNCVSTGIQLQKWQGRLQLLHKTTMLESKRCTADFPRGDLPTLKKANTLRFST